MTVQEIVNLALSNTHTKSSQISAANQILFFNLSRKNIAKSINKDVNENFFFQIWDVDAEDNTNANRANGEYLYPVATSSQVGMKTLLSLAIKGYSTDTYFTPCVERELKELQRYHDWLWYVTNQPKSNPVYYIADKSFFIAPRWLPADLPDSPSGNCQIKCYGIASLTDLAIDAAATSVLIPDDQHEKIALGMEQYIYKARKKKQEAFDSMAEFAAAKQEMVDELTNRDQSYMQATLPNDIDLQYAGGALNNFNINR